MTSLQSLRSLAEKATPGPWCCCSLAHIECREIADVGPLEIHSPSTPFSRGDDAPFIAACDPQTIMSILDRLDALEKVAEAAENRCVAYLTYSYRSDAIAAKIIYDCDCALEEACHNLKSITAAKKDGAA